MILVAGGQLDPNIGALLKRVLLRKIPFRDLLVGPDSSPLISIDLPEACLVLGGERVMPSACFVRHDVFWSQKEGGHHANAASLNWFYAIRGWALSWPDIKILNRHSYLSENNKIQNLLLALNVGLNIPKTKITNLLNEMPCAEDYIQKPVAGGEYTTMLSDFLREKEDKEKFYPRFIQRRLNRPELRIFRIGPSLLAFSLLSNDVDYRVTQKVEIECAPVPGELAQPLVLLCDRLGLDFAAADFMLDDEAGWRFLEVNSQPMFARFDQVCDGQLTGMLLDFLVGSL
ncbi:hypothetical protein [Enterovirga sp.]|uniref:hypothetical protein n=1 Tax=Enterovirga sp. TaxID=2026350 RepID=UPI002C2C920C|nr:hypothetical protein [Enterovirga sp.]HMO28577.1 hypothetical protein [Enterovirga sp.]